MIAFRNEIRSLDKNNVLLRFQKEQRQKSKEKKLSLLAVKCFLDYMFAIEKIIEKKTKSFGGKILLNKSCALLKGPREKIEKKTKSFGGKNLLNKTCALLKGPRKKTRKKN